MRVITVSGLTQWSYGQVLLVGGLELSAVTECHISYQSTGGQAERLAGTVDGDKLSLEIPDLYLAKETAANYSIYVFIYVTTLQSGRTIYKVILPVEARPKPEGYVPGVTDPFSSVIHEMEDILEDARDASVLSQSWAVGGTGTRIGENADNSKYYARMAEEAAAEKGFVSFEIVSPGQLIMYITENLTTAINFVINDFGELEVQYL